ncbi:ABC transporter ATP-binding protein [bacterium]|nr:ABC transporter ATP-binding protein [bacterium]
MVSFERISVKSLTKSFKNSSGGKVTIFENVSFELEKGGILRLSGASGSGKTTFMNVMSGLVKPDSGSVFFGNTDITALSEGKKDRFRAENIGYIFQTFNLLSPFSVIENVYAPLAFAGRLPQNYKDKALESLDKVGMKEFAAKKPYHLSVGQKQRVAVARVLFADPPLVFADEPTASLDRSSSELVKNTLLELNKKGTTLVLTSHDSIFDDVKPDIDFNLETGVLS